MNKQQRKLAKKILECVEDEFTNDKPFWCDDWENEYWDRPLEPEAEPRKDFEKDLKAVLKRLRGAIK